MMLRIIHGKLKPGTWESYERAYKEVTAKAGKIPGLKGRWLAHAVDDPDAGYTMSLWADEAAMRAYESSEVLQQTILPHLSPFSRAITLQRGARFGLRKSSSNCEG
jgi:heme-degrading monooxygenase HmoA